MTPVLRWVLFTTRMDWVCSPWEEDGSRSDEVRFCLTRTTTPPIHTGVKWFSVILVKGTLLIDSFSPHTGPLSSHLPLPPPPHPHPSHTLSTPSQPHNPVPFGNWSRLIEHASAVNRKACKTGAVNWDSLHWLRQVAALMTRTGCCVSCDLREQTKARLNGISDINTTEAFFLVWRWIDPIWDVCKSEKEGGKKDG